ASGRRCILSLMPHNVALNTENLASYSERNKRIS
ncbi:unnamed protein product, partial [Oikopleura dioica]